jgi:hypothetical protein
MSQHDVYRSAFRDKFGLRTWIPAWRPGADLRLGMTGRIVNGEFVYEYDLEDRGVQLPTPDTADPGKDEYQWSTEGGVQVSIKAAGEPSAAFSPVATADVGFRLQFSKSDAMAVLYRDVVEHRYPDQRSVAEQMVKSWAGGPWPKMQIGDVAITAVLVAGWGFVFGAASEGAEVVLNADASLGQPGASVGSVRGAVGVARQESTSVAALSTHGLVIGYRGLELRQTGMFSRRTVAKPRLESKQDVERDLILSRDEFQVLAD